MRRKKIFSAIFAFLLTLTLAFAGAQAASNIDLNHTGSITITLLSSDEPHNPIINAVLDLYTVGEAKIDNNNLIFEATADFLPSGIAIDDLSNPDIAENLLDYARKNNIAYISSETNDEGSAVFAGLHVGLYLISQREGAANYYPIKPFLIAIPMTSADGTEWIYDVDASPKAQPGQVYPPEFISITVEKIWEDENNANHTRPNSITVELYRGNELYDTVILNAENGWSYVWENLDAAFSWTVREYPVPVHYIVNYRYCCDSKIIITNTEKLIQTGQINLPIPLFAAAGTLFLTAGAIISVSSKHKKEHGKKDHEGR